MAAMNVKLDNYLLNIRCSKELGGQQNRLQEDKQKLEAFREAGNRHHESELDTTSSRLKLQSTEKGHAALSLIVQSNNYSGLRAENERLKAIWVAR